MQVIGFIVIILIIVDIVVNKATIIKTVWNEIKKLFSN